MSSFYHRAILSSAYALLFALVRSVMHALLFAVVRPVTYALLFAWRMHLLLHEAPYSPSPLLGMQVLLPHPIHGIFRKQSIYVFSLFICVAYSLRDWGGLS